MSVDLFHKLILIALVGANKNAEANIRLTIGWVLPLSVDFWGHYTQLDVMADAIHRTRAVPREIMTLPDFWGHYTQLDVIAEAIHRHAGQSLGKS